MILKDFEKLTKVNMVVEYETLLKKKASDKFEEKAACLEKNLIKSSLECKVLKKDLLNSTLRCEQLGKSIKALEEKKEVVVEPEQYDGEDEGDEVVVDENRFFGKTEAEIVTELKIGFERDTRKLRKKIRKLRKNKK